MPVQSLATGIDLYYETHGQGEPLVLIPATGFAADVWLLWECDSGHRFIATPEEQRMRPGRERRRSTWCPTCSDLARGRAPKALPMRVAVRSLRRMRTQMPMRSVPAPRRAAAPIRSPRWAACAQCASRRRRARLRA